MDKHVGRVQRIDNDHHAWVLAERTGACGGCSQHHGCCAMVDGQHRMLLKVKNVPDAQPGDQVMFRLNERIRLKWMLILYATPVLGILIGAITAAIIWNTEGMTVAGTLIGLILGFGVVKLLAGRTHAVKEMTPEIVGIQRNDAAHQKIITSTVSHGCCA